MWSGSRSAACARPRWPRSRWAAARSPPRPTRPSPTSPRSGSGSPSLSLPTTWLISESGHVDSQQWDERYSAAGFVWATGPNQFVEAELAGLPPGRALDVAAGEGRNTVWLAERGWHVTAVDFSRVGLEKGRKLSAARGVDEDRVTWIVADLHDYRPEPACFDLVLIAYAQVAPDLRAALLARASAAVAPGGTMFVVG